LTTNVTESQWRPAIAGGLPIHRVPGPCPPGSLEAKQQHKVTGSVTFTLFCRQADYKLWNHRRARGFDKGGTHRQVSRQTFTEKLTSPESAAHRGARQQQQVTVGSGGGRPLQTEKLHTWRPSSGKSLHPRSCRWFTRNFTSDHVPLSAGGSTPRLRTAAALGARASFPIYNQTARNDISNSYQMGRP